MDKAASKSVLQANGLPVVPWLSLREADWKSDPARFLRRVRRTLPLPVFVKPANLGSSVGVTKVVGAGGLPDALAAAFRYDTTVLVEKGIRGRELECSVLGNETPEASLPGEVIPSREFYDYNDKYVDGRTAFGIPARLPAGTRVDFFLERGTNRLYVNEINTIPGFTEISMYPKLWAVSGLPFPLLLERLIELGFERSAGRRACLDRDR